MSGEQTAVNYLNDNYQRFADAVHSGVNLEPSFRHAANLQRVLDVIDDFRGSSQMIVVTHQKRTMEIADVLYGVTMRSGGVSKVLSQRLTDVA